MKPPRSHPTALLLLALAAAPMAAAQTEAPESAAALRVQLELEEGLLEADVRAYQEGRVQERAAAEEVDAAAQELDAGIAGGTASVQELEGLEMARAVAAAAAEIVSGRVAELRQRILERSRRSRALREALLAAGEPEAVGDPVSGRWRVEVAGGVGSGIFDLGLDGTVVEGTYSLESGRMGSLRGTYVAGRLSLEQIDAEQGLVGVFQGTVDAALGLVRGFWSPADLSSGGPGGSGWSGVRISSSADEEGEQGSQGESG